jgi:intein/homing endonuclease
MALDPRDYAQDYEGDVGAGYPQPELGRKNQGLVSSLLKTAAIFALSPQVNKAIDAGLHLASRGLAGTIAKTAMKIPTSWIAKALNITPATTFKGGLGTLLKGTDAWKSVSTGYNKYLTSKGIDRSYYTNWAKIGERQATPKITKTSDWGLNLPKWSDSGSKYAYTSSQRMARNRAFFKDRLTNRPAYRGRLFGAAENFMKDYARQLPGMVITDKAINYLTGKRDPNRRTAWWNIPGHAVNLVGDIAKSSVTYLPFYAGFKGLTTAATFGKDILERGIRYSSLKSGGRTGSGTRGTFTNDIIFQASRYTDKMMGKMHKGFTGKLKNAWTEYQGNFSWEYRTTGSKKSVSITDTALKYIKSMRTGYKKTVTDGLRKTSYNQSEMGDLSSVISSGDFSKVSGPKPEMLITFNKLKGVTLDGEMGAAVSKLYEAQGRPKGGFLSNALGLRPKSYARNIKNQIIDNIKGEDSIGTYGKLMDKGMRLYYQKGVYDLGLGRTLDVSELLPSKLISKGVDYLTEALGFTVGLRGKKIRPLEILGVKMLKDYALGITPDVKVWTGKEGHKVRVGSLDQTTRANLRGTLGESTYNERGAFIELAGEGRIVQIRTGKGVGRMHFQSEKGGGVTLPGEYRLFNTPLGGQLRKVQDSLYGYFSAPGREILNRYNAKTPEEESELLIKNTSMNSTWAWLQTHILRSTPPAYRKEGKWAFGGLEIGAGYGGPSMLQRGKNFLSKFIDKRSPIVIHSKDKGFFSSLEGTSFGSGVNYVTPQTYNPIIEGIQRSRSLLEEGYTEGFRTINSSKVFSKISSDRIQGIGSTNLTLGEIWDDSKSGREKLLGTVSDILRQSSGNSPRSYEKAQHALEQIRSNEGYFKHIATISPRGRELTAADELKMFVFKHHISMQDKPQYLENLLRGSGAPRTNILDTMSKEENILIKSIDNLAMLERKISGGIPKPNSNITADKDDALMMNDITQMMRDQGANMEDLSRIITPSWSTNLPHKFAGSSFTASTTNSEYEAVQVSKWFPIMENITSEGGILKGIQKTIFPHYVEKNSSGEMTMTGDRIPTPVRFATEAALRLNKMAANFGMGLNTEQRTTWDQLGKGMLTNIYLPMLGLYSAYKGLDTLTDTNPAFEGSLKYEELVLVRHRDSGIIKYIKIGELVDKLDSTEYDAWTNDGGNICFKPINGGIRHKRETPLVRLELDNYSDILVTTNHSLFTGQENNLQITQPVIGNSITQCSKVPPREVIYNQLNILDYIEDDNPKVFVVVRDERLDSKWRYNSNGQFTAEYHRWLLDNVTYDGRKYVCSIRGARLCPSDYIHLLRLALYRSRITLPIIYNLDYNFGYIAGIFVSEGSSIFGDKLGGYASCRVSIAAEEGYSGYKGNIRDRITSSMLDVFPECLPFTNWQSISLLGYLYYKLFRDILDCGSGASSKRIPDIVMNGTDECVKGFLHGYFDGDGTYNSSGNGTFKFTTISRELTCQMVLLLNQLGADVFTHSSVNTYDAYIGSRRINSKYRQYKIVARNITIGKFEVKKSYKSNSIRRLGNTSIVKSMEMIEQDDYVYDISVEGSEKFVAGTGMIYAHNTMLDEGLSVAIGEQVAKADLKLSRVGDLLGVTHMAKWAEGLMPGSVSSPLTRMGIAIGAPLAGAAIGSATGGLPGGLYGSLAGLGVSASTGFGFHDFTKSRKEQEDIYAGRELVPIRAGRGWEAGRTPWAGGRINYWRPGWMARMKSQYQYTPTMYGSKMEEFLYRNPIMQPFALLTDPYHWERKSYLSAPSPQTAPLFEEVPFVGPILSATVGRVIKPIKTMHGDELAASFSSPGYAGASEGIGGGFFPPVGIGGNVDSPFKQTAGGDMSLEMRHPAPASQQGASQTLARTIYRGWIEPAGIIGFGTQTLMGGPPMSEDTVIGNSGYRTSMTRAYWDLQLGGALGMCLVGDTLIHTNRGLIPISSVTTEDKVVSKDGLLHDVVHIQANGVRSDIYKLTTSTSELYATSNHKIPVSNEVGGELTNTRVIDIAIGSYVVYPIPVYSNTIHDRIDELVKLMPLIREGSTLDVVTNIYNLLLSVGVVGKIYNVDGNYYIDWRPSDVSNIHNNMLYTQVVSVELTSRVEVVYNMEVDTLHYYVANMILSSNSEYARRFMPRNLAYSSQQRWNPLRNTQPDWMPGGADCVTPDTDIVMYDSTIKKATCINEGDTLLSSDGDPNTVINKVTKIVDTTVDILINGDAVHTYKFSDNHPIYTSNHEFINAIDIKKGDYLSYPRRLYTDEKVEIVDLSDYLQDTSSYNIGITDNYIYYGHNASNCDLIELAERYNYEYETLPSYTKIDKKIRKSLWGICNKYYKQMMRIPRYWSKQDLFYLIGVYIAEGSISSKNQFSFSGNTNDKWTDRLISIMNTYNVRYSIYLSGNEMRVNCSSVPIHCIVKNMCNGYSDTKYVHNSFIEHSNSRDAMISLISGMIDGDASYITEKDGNIRLSYSSASIRLAEQFRQICMDVFGIAPTISRYINKDGFVQYNCRISGKHANIIASNVGYTLYDYVGTRNGAYGYYCDDEYVYVKVREVTICNISCEVIGYTMSGNSTFCTAGFATHNSTYFRDFKYGDNSNIPECLHPETEVLMYDGSIRIADDVSEGDILVSKGGLPVEVLCRRDKNVDKTVSITISGDNYHKSVFSEDHPIYTSNHEFVNAIDVKYGDYVSYPRRRHSDGNTTVDISKLLTNDKYGITDRYVYYAASASTAHLIEIAEEYGFDIHNIPSEYKTTRKDEQRIRSVCKSRNSSTILFKRIPRYWKAEDLYYLLGVYAAEGHINKFTFVLTGHNDDKWYNDIIRILGTYNVKYSIHRSNKKDVITLHSSCTPLIDILQHKAPGLARTKKISDDMLHIDTNVNAIRLLIKGMMDGDGNYCKCATGVVMLGYTTTSEELAYEVRRLHIDVFGIAPVVTRHMTQWGYIYKLRVQGNLATEIAGYLEYNILEWNPTRKTVCNQYHDEEYVYVKVKKVEVINEPSRVVGFAVSGDNTFCTALMATHNSELIMPGWSNMAAYNVKLTMPMRASSLGKSYAETVQYLTGTRPPADVAEEEVMESGTAIHKIIMEELGRAGMLVKKEAEVYDPYADISGTVDAIVRQGRENAVMEFKTVSSEKLARLSAPQSQHRSQINFYLKQLRLRQGSIVYISREDPTLTKAFPVTFNYGLYQRNVQELQQARGAANDILSRGLGNPGEAYSHLDRLMVLVNVCVPPDTLLQSDWGRIVRADEVSVGDMLLSHTGNPRRVSDVYKRPYSGNIYKIKTKYDYEPLVVTPTHPIYAIRTTMCRKGGNSKHGICKPCKNCIIAQSKAGVRGYTIDHKWECIHKHYEDYQAEFIPANELSIGDVILYPVPIEEKVPTQLRISEYIGGNFTYNDDTLNGSPMVHRYGKGYNTFIKDNIPLMKSFYTIAGWYLAEGCVAHSNGVVKGVQFSFNYNEVEYVDEVLKYMKFLFGIDGVVSHRVESNSTTIIYSNQLLGELFSKMFGEKNWKMIPSFIVHAPIEYVKALLRSYILGDGYSAYLNSAGSNGGFTLSTTSVSRELSVQIRNMLLRLGAISALKVRHRDKEQVFPNGKSYKSKDGYIVNLTGRDNVVGLCRALDIDIDYPDRMVNMQTQGWIANGYLHLPITDISIDEYEGLVYNYEVDVDNSYCTISHAVHNCPYSDEFKKELGVVTSQNRAGMLSPEDQDKMKKILAMRKSVTRPIDLYPRRFDLKGIVNPSDTYQLLSENKNIKPASEYNIGERLLGGGYEYLTRMRTPLHTKLIGQYSPREDYERSVLYGTKSAFWNEPWRDFVEPYMRGSLSTDRPDEGIIRGLLGGFIFGGGMPGAIIGGGALGVYGIVNGAARYMTGTTYVPGNVKRKWEIADYFDKLEYIKANRLYEMTGMNEYARKMGETMTGINPMNVGRSSYTDMARAVPNDIKPYIFSFINETNPDEREKIASELPDNVANLLRIKWAMADKDVGAATELNNTRRTSNDLTEYYKKHYLPEESWCVIEDQPIILQDRIDIIKNVNVGDIVVNRGVNSIVEKVHRRYVNEEIASISVFGDKIHTLDITYNHNIFVMKTSKCWKAHGIRCNKVCISNREWFECDTCSNIFHSKYNIEECSVSDISVGDYVIIPKIKFAKVANTYECISEEDTWWLIGLFAAEGSYYYYTNKIGEKIPKALIFSLNIDEEYIANRISRISNDIGLTCSKYYNIRDDGSSLNVCIFGTDMATYVHNIIGAYSSYKKLHVPLSSLSYNAAYSFCVGLFNGDATKTEICRTRLATNSYELAVQTKLLLLSLGIGATLLSRDRTKWDRGIQYIVNVSNANDAEFINDATFCNNNIHKQTYSKYIFTDNYVMAEVLDISNYIYNGSVYDLSVTSQHEYFPMVALVHNSGWNPNQPLEDVMLKTVEHEGFTAHEFGAGWYCITPDQMLVDIYGNSIQASDIVTGDKLLSADGSNNIVDVIHKRVASKEKLVYVTVEGYKANTISATDNHQVLVIRCDKECLYKDGENSRYCKMDSNKNYCIGCNVKDTYEHEYIPIGDLIPHTDFVVIPAPIYDVRESLMVSDVIDINNITNGKIAYDKRVILKGVDYGIMSFNYDRKFTTFDDTELYNEDIYRLFGYYLAEGNIINRKKDRRSKRGGIQLTFGSTEGHLVEDVVRIVGDNFNITPKVHVRPKKNTIDVSIHSTVIGELFFTLLGEYSHQKHIDSRVFHAPPECRLELIRGYMVGDGCIMQGRGTNMMVKSSSASKQLTLNILMLCRSLGMNPSYTITTKNKVYNRKLLYNVCLYGKSYDIYTTSNTITGGNIYRRVTDVDVIDYTGDVYDFTMRGDHSYSTYGLTYHNSQSRRIKNSPYTPSAINMSDTTGALVTSSVDTNSITGSIKQVLSQYGVQNISVSATSTPGVGSRVTINLNVDHSEQVRTYLGGR